MIQSLTKVVAVLFVPSAALVGRIEPFGTDAPEVVGIEPRLLRQPSGPHEGECGVEALGESGAGEGVGAGRCYDGDPASAMVAQ